VTHISSLALACACSGILLGCAVIGASTIVVANQSKLQLAFDAPRIQSLAHPVTPMKIRVAGMTADDAEDARRAVRVVNADHVAAR